MQDLTHFHSPLSPEHWLRDLFSSKAARDIERLAGWDLFLSELDRRGYHAIENCGQVVIFCNNAPVHVLR